MQAFNVVENVVSISAYDPITAHPPRGDDENQPVEEEEEDGGVQTKIDVRHVSTESAFALF